jgi:hypothetical protein
VANTRDGQFRFEITWLEPEITGYTDLLEAHYFWNRGSASIFPHSVRCPRGGIGQAKCRIHLGSRRADLDYQAFRDFNEEHEMALGIMRLFFADADLTQIAKVLWKEHGSNEFLTANVEVELLSVRPSPPYRRPKTTALRRQRLVQERPGQIKFRQNLKAAYEEKCSVSGCSVSNALEGAHIDRFSDGASDNIRDGLLLRRDLHGLFDAGFLAIEPKSHFVHFAPEACEWDEYNGWHRTKKLREPIGGEAHAPSPAAIKRRWLKFTERFPDVDGQVEPSKKG